MKNNIDINYVKSELVKIQKYFLEQKFEKVVEKTKKLIKKDPNQVPFYNYIGLFVIVRIIIPAMNIKPCDK